MNNQKSENILNFIQEYIQTNQIAPSVREICEGLNISSTSTVHRYLHYLEAEGKLHMNTKKKRAIYISDSRMQGIPLIEQVQPGTDLLDEQNVKSYYQLDAGNPQNPIFAFSLMKDYPEFGFRKQDMLIAEKMLNIGKIIVFLNEDNQLEITAADEIPSGWEAVGSVITLIRKF